MALEGDGRRPTMDGLPGALSQVGGGVLEPVGQLVVGVQGRRVEVDPSEPHGSSRPHHHQGIPAAVSSAEASDLSLRATAYAPAQRFSTTILTMAACQAGSPAFAVVSYAA